MVGRGGAALTPLAAGLLLALLLPVAGAADRMPGAQAGPDRAANAGEAVWLNGTAQDDGYIVKYEWDFEGDGVYEWSSVQSGNASHVYNAPGVFTASFRVTDNGNQVATDTAKVTIKTKNRAPFADAGPDRPGEVDVPMAFNGTGIDFDGQVVRYDWDFESDGVWDYSGPVGNITRVYQSPGEYIAMLRVTDNANPPANDTDLCKATIYPRNQGPAANAGPPVTGAAGEPVLLAGKGMDPDGDIALYDWDFDGDGRWDWTSASTGAASWKYWEPGTYAARLRVTDNAPIPASDVSSTTVTIVPRNNSPVITGPENLKAVAGRTLRMTVFAVDGDPGDGVQRYGWDFDGNGVVEYYSSDGNASYIFNSSGGYVVKVTAFDTRNATAVWRINVTAAEPPAAGSAMSELLPYIVVLLIGIGTGAGIGGPVAAWYMKKHWERFFKPTKLERMQMKADLEMEEGSASSFRGLRPGGPGTPPPGDGTDQRYRDLGT